MNAPFRVPAPTRSYGRMWLDRDRNAWVMETREAHVAIRLKKNFERIRKGSTSPFRFPADDVHATELAWFMSLYPMTMSEADRAELEDGQTRRATDVAEVGRILEPDWRPAAPARTRPGRGIRVYQEQAVSLVLRLGSLLLADDVGLGKTYAAIGLALRSESLPMAIVVYGHLQQQWVEKFADTCDLACHMVRTTKAYTLPDVPIVIFRYSNIRGWADVFATGRFRSAVWDEIQELRAGTKTEKGHASMALTRNTRFQLGLSATPIYNYGAEIHEILQFLPGRRTGHVLGGREEFLREWCSFGGVVNDPTALGSYLRDQNVLLRRTKGDVGQQMDRVTTSVVDVPYDLAEERRVEDLARTLAITSLTGSYLARGRAARELDLLMRQATGIAKARGVAQFVRMLVEVGHQVLLGGWHRGYYDVIRRELHGIELCLFTGTETPAGKERSKQAFVSGSARVMVISNRSGSGLDGIQAVCSTLVVGELDWSGEVHKQLIGRLDREGQTLPVSVYYAVSDGGSDPAIVEVLGLKASQAQGIVDPDRLTPRPEVDEGRLTRLARDWLTRRGIAIPEVDDPADREALAAAE